MRGGRPASAGSAGCLRCSTRACRKRRRLTTTPSTTQRLDELAGDVAEAATPRRPQLAGACGVRRRRRRAHPPRRGLHQCAPARTRLKPVAGCNHGLMVRLPSPPSNPTGCVRRPSALWMLTDESVTCRPRNSYWAGLLSGRPRMRSGPCLRGGEWSESRPGRAQYGVFPLLWTRDLGCQLIDVLYPNSYSAGCNTRAWSGGG